jgi:hypothetical protein
MEILLVLKINLLKWLNCFTKDYDNLDEEIDENIINQYQNL